MRTAFCAPVGVGLTHNREEIRLNALPRCRQIQCHGTDPVSTGDEVSAELTSCLGIKQNPLSLLPTRLDSSLGAICVKLLQVR